MAPVAAVVYRTALRSCAAVFPRPILKSRRIHVVLCYCPPLFFLQDIERAADILSVQDTDIWQIIYAPLCFIVGFRILFYLALITKHSGSRK